MIERPRQLVQFDVSSSQCCPVERTSVLLMPRLTTTRSHSSRADETVVLLESRRDSTPSSAGIDWENKSGLMSPPFRTTSHFASSGSHVVAYSDNEKRRDLFKPELGEVSPRQVRRVLTTSRSRILTNRCRTASRSRCDETDGCGSGS